VRAEQRVAGGQLDIAESVTQNLLCCHGGVGRSQATGGWSDVAPRPRQLD